MAPLKQPGTLQSLAQERLAKLTLDACRKHEKTIVSNDIFQRVKIVEEIQEFIGALPEMLLNELCQVMIRMLLPRKNFFVNRKVSTYALAVVMHKDVNQITIDCDLVCQTHGTESFWNDRFRSMSKLSEVNFKQSVLLSFVSTITKSCPNLKKITLPSSMNSSEFTMAEAKAAISLLSRCSQLRYIDCGGLIVKYGVSMQHLLESLPGLEVCIVPENDSLGAILTRIRNNGSLQLQLRYFKQGTATPTHIESMIAVCPQVTDLILRPRSVEASDVIMDILKNSILKIQTFKFDFKFPIIQNRFESFFESKGSYLKSLDLHFYNECIFHFDVVRSIGKFCPHLEKLTIRIDGISCDSALPANSSHIVVPPEGKRLFQKLSTLHFVCFLDSSSVRRSVRYCLENSVHLTTLLLYNVFKRNTTFDEFVQIFAVGRMQELKYLELNNEQGPVITKQMMQYLYESYQQLTFVKFNENMVSRDAEKYLEELIVEATKNNIDFVAQILSDLY